ncbi:MAG TPA: S8 family serine peptidase [Woeseiaceae bacterium]|nr:S8 family serine peptidase [Woeseiaceae bacterium]
MIDGDVSGSGELQRRILRWVAAIAILAVVGSVVVEELVDYVAPPPVLMPGGDVTGKGVSPGLEEAFRMIGGGERLHFVVQFRHELSERELGEVGRRTGIDFEGPVPEFAYITSVTKERWPGVRDALQSESPPAIRIIGIRPADRLAPEWGEADNPDVPGYAQLPSGSVAIFVRFFDDVSETAQRQILAGTNGTQPGRARLRVGPTGVWAVFVPEASLLALANTDAVRFIEPATPPVELDMDLARTDVGVPVLDADGDGAVIAQWEQCQARLHTDTTDRITGIGTPLALCLDPYFQDLAFNNQFDITDPIGIDEDYDGSVDRLLHPGSSLTATNAPWHKLERFISEEGKLYVKKPYGDPSKLEDGDIELRTDGVAGTVTPAVVPSATSGSLSPYNPAVHPTLVAGIMISNSNSATTTDGDPLYQGVAPAARIRTHAWNHFSTTDEYPAAVGAGARVSSNSFGWDDYHFVTTKPPYDRISAFYDSASSGRISGGTANALGGRILVVASSGNAGHEAPFWRTGRIANSAKNVVTVGNVSSSAKVESADSLGVPAYDSGRGPTSDGRLTPILVAPGDQLLCEISGGDKTCAADDPDSGIMSTVPGDAYRDARGTSFSTPIVSGAAALLSRIYEDACSIIPTPADLRALMVHSARDLTDASNLDPLQGAPPLTGPDYVFGYGLLQADKAAALVRHTVRDEMSAGWIEHRVLIDSDAQLAGKVGEQQLRVTLVWDDVPYDPGAPPREETGVLQNDLDLEVIDPDGNRHLPWLLDPSPGNEGNPATRRSRPSLMYVLQEHRDHANTIEQVVVDVSPAMMKKTWTFRVRDFRLRRGSQSYTLVSEAFRQAPGAACGTFSNGDTRRISHPYELPDTALGWMLFWLAVIILLWLTMEALLWLWFSNRNKYGALIALLMVLAVLVLLTVSFRLLHIREFVWLSGLVLLSLVYALWRAAR